MRDTWGAIMHHAGVRWSPIRPANPLLRFRSVSVSDDLVLLGGTAFSSQFLIDLLER